MIIRTAILRRMERLEMTQLELSARADVSRANLNRWLNGRGTLTVESVERLMRVLGLRVVAQSEKRKTKSENEEGVAGGEA